MASVYELVTERIIAELEKGEIPWHKPWTGLGGERNGAWSRSTGRAYSLLNQMLLGKPGEYLTFKQCEAAGGKVRKGEKSSMVVFWKQVAVDDEEEKDENGKPKKKLVPMLRYYNVFHIDQCDGIEAKYKAAEIGRFDPIAEAQAIADEYSEREHLTIDHVAGDEAFYSPARDCIQLPLREMFPENREYYSTLFHEMVHSTGHKSRLNRLDRVAAFGSEDYSKEELTAEIGAAALMNRVGIETARTFKNSAAYIQSWLEALRNDTRMIVSASSRAEKAVNYIINGAA